MSPRVTPRRRGAYSTPAIAASRPIPPTSYELALERAEREQRDRSTWQQYVATMPARDEQRSARDIAASHAVTTADTRASWRWATARTGVDPRGTLNKEENRALSKASGGAGGFVVPTDFDQAIIAA